MEMGQWVMGHGSNGSPFLDGSRGSRVTASDPLTHDDEITAQYLAILLFLVYIKKMPTHSVSPIIIAGGLILIYNLIFLPSRLKGLFSTTVPRPHFVPCVGVIPWVMGRGSCGLWVNCVMGHMGHGSRTMTHFHL